MGRGHKSKKPRTMARDFKEKRENTWRAGTGSEAPHRAGGGAGSGSVQANGSWDISPEGMTNEAFEVYYKVPEA